MYTSTLRTKPGRRDDVVLSYAEQAPGLLQGVLLAIASGIAPAFPLLGEASPAYVRLAHQIARLPEDADPRGPLGDLVAALLDAWRP
jgi:hypothetical protein